MGFLDTVNKAKEPITVELKSVLEDGKRAAVKCRPLIAIDYFSMGAASGYDAIPVLTGEKRAEAMSTAEKMKLYEWFREVVCRSVIQVRDVKDGQSIWQPVKFVLDEMEPVTDNGTMRLSLRILEELNGGEVIDVANAIINRTNFSQEIPKRVRK